MTQPEFQAWIEAHYGELLAVASRLVNNPEDATEILHDAIAGIVAHPRAITSPWSYTVQAIRTRAFNRRRSAARKSFDGPESIKFEDGNRPGGSPDEIRRKLKRLTPEQNTERWLQRNYLRSLEGGRKRVDMDGYGRKQTLQGSNNHPDDNGNAPLDPPFHVVYSVDKDTPCQPS